MPKIDEIDIGSKKIVCLNLSDTVGGPGRNLPGDVMVIQALFNYIAATEETIRGLNLGNWSSDAVPEVSGDAFQVNQPMKQSAHTDAPDSLS